MLVNRALLYALLTAAVVAVYVLVVGGVGAVLDAARRRLAAAGWPPPWWPSAFQPLREALQRGVNRLTYGAWHEPHALVRSACTPGSSRRPAPTGHWPTSWPPSATTCGWSHLSVRTPDGEVLAEAGTPTDAVRPLPLVHAGTPVGELPSAAARAGGGTRRSWPSWPAPWRPRSRRPGCTRTCSAPGSGWCSPARRSGGGCGATCTTGSAPRSPGSP